jgi:hypothetical protein
MNKVIIIGAEVEHEPCEYCGKVDELRPYGKNGAKICYDCGMKPENVATTDEAFRKVLTGESELPTKEQSN